ncbi:MAG: carboxypeptidase regulatory-like domain-containing protein, partial [Burkholderiales bacterium]
MAHRFRFIGLAIALVAMLLLASPALAQFGEAKGSLYGKAVDEQGGVLPGTAVTLTGVGATQSQVTNAQGEYRFINLAPGNYTVTLALAGFTTVNHENVAVHLGRTTITDTLKLSPVAATITVRGETPLLDTRKVQLGAQITPDELKSIPTARDPWVMLQSTPGIQIDRMNVAGSESGQQSTFTSKGSNGGSFAVDGINFTDLTALGASAGYYDFDSFQEIQVITGGADPSIAGDGAHINMITKRGTNEVHGSTRLNVVSDHFEWTNVPEEAQTQSVGVGAGNLITSVQEYGAEAGGPLVKDHLWLWGAYGRNQVDLLVAGNRTDKTTLENFNVKLNAQPFTSNSVDIYYQRSDKLKAGRGAGTNRSQETTTNQTTPANVWKVQDSHVFSSNLFASFQYNGEDGRFTLTPQGGLASQIYFDPLATAHNSFYFLNSRRPQRQIKGDVSYS